ncbi:MAG TPA: iron-sulfur cluster biosynthesis family protein [Chryseosolibacter sp.]
MFDNIRPVSISTRACREIHQIMKAKAIPSQYGLRVGVRGGGCGGVSLIIGFDTKKETDLAYDVDGIPVYVDKKHTMYLMGRQVDFIDEADGKGFIFVGETRDPD